MSDTTLAPPPTIDWSDWLRRWDRQQEGYLPDREERFAAMLDVLDVQLQPGQARSRSGCWAASPRLRQSPWTPTRSCSPSGTAPWVTRAGA
jgi:hypothetical protein